jgi:hypothetical protein
MPTVESKQASKNGKDEYDHHGFSKILGDADEREMKMTILTSLMDCKPLKK